MMEQGELFGIPAPRVPPGMRYERDFLSRDDEVQLIAKVQQLPLANMRYKGYTALRRVVSYGGKYDFDANRLESAEPIPDWVAPWMERAGQWAGLPPSSFTQVLVAEYQPGTPLGWHRDVPDFEDIVGISLRADAEFRFRPYPPDAATKKDVMKVVVAPRSIYLLQGASRWEWQHSVAPTKDLRYSITLRTPRRR